MRLFVRWRSCGGFVAVRLLLVSLMSVACTSRSGVAPSASPESAITRVEISRSQALNAYDAVRILRPSMLRERGKVSMVGSDVREPIVYLDNQRLGGISVLRDIPVTEIFEIRYHSAAQAQIKWGNGHLQGVIQVVTARTSGQ